MILFSDFPWNQRQPELELCKNTSVITVLHDKLVVEYIFTYFTMVTLVSTKTAEGTCTSLLAHPCKGCALMQHYIARE